MTEAAVFYEAASPRLGSDFLGDVQRGIDLVRGQPSIGRNLEQGLRRMLLQKFLPNLRIGRRRDSYRCCSAPKTAT